MSWQIAYLGKGRYSRTELSLKPQIFRDLCHVMWRPMLDAFATSFNHKLPFYIGPFPDAKGPAVDDVSLNWTGIKSCAGCF